MVIIYTFQDFQEMLTDAGVAAAAKSIIDEHKSSDNYKIAVDAGEYYAHRNTTIAKYQKLIYTVTGQMIKDKWSPNFKMASNFYYRFITDQVQYLLGNGIKLDDMNIKDRLSTARYNFDVSTVRVATFAKNGGTGFGFVNFDHIEPFSLTEFAPLYDEENGALMAGVRFWQLHPTKPLRAIIYETDGYTSVIYRPGQAAEVGPKTPYKRKVSSTIIGGDVIYDGENYPTFPIVPLFANDEHQSEIVGLKEQIDCYDLIKSGYANTVDEASILYWLVKNAGGMDDNDLAKLVYRLKTTHAAAIDEEGQIQPQSVDVPYESREALLALLSKDLYAEAMCVHPDALKGVTATEIISSYRPMNLKTNEFEYQVIDYLHGVFAVIGIEGEHPTFERDMITNTTEAVNNLVALRDAFDEEYFTEKALLLMGDGDKLDDVMKRKIADDLGKFKITENDADDDEQDESEDEAE